MHAALLIDAIVRQTTVLIATLATASGQRAQLAHVANLVFADLVRELREQGLGNKIIADMFGLALRTYHRKLARLSASRTEQGQSLWEAVLRFVQLQGPVSRAAVLQRFVRDDEAVVRSVLNDLVDSELLRPDGHDDSARLEAVDAQGKPGTSQPATLDAMILVALHRAGQLAPHELAAHVPAGGAELEASLTRLADAGLVYLSQHGGQKRYGCENFAIAFGDEAGWEAAVFDHYQALVAALVSKLRSGPRRAELADHIGGSTFAFEVWDGHPMRDEVLGFLKRVREQGIALRRALEQHAASTPMPQGVEPLRVTAYVGQNVVRGEGEGDDA